MGDWREQVEIGGVVPCSFVDYPGHCAAVIFTQGCNMQCGYCHNKQLWRVYNTAADERRRDADDVMSLLRNRVGRLGGVVISGGEPTIHDGLLGMIEAIKDLGYPVKLDTNGSRPSVLKRLLKSKLLDYVALDFKRVPCLYRRLGLSCGKDVLRSIALLSRAGVRYELRTTVYDDHSVAELKTMERYVPIGATWYLQRDQNCWLGDEDIDYIASTIYRETGALCVARTKTGDARATL